MKLFSFFNTILQIRWYILLTFFISSCASHEIRLGKSYVQNKNDTIKRDTSQINHTFFLLGDAGDTKTVQAKQTLEQLKKELEKAPSNSTLIFLGDNIYPKGMPPATDSVQRNEAEEKLTLQIDATRKFSGKTVFIPGNHDWYNGIEGLNEQERIINEKLNQKKTFLPRKGCAIETLKVNDLVAVIIIDSEWYLQNWDKHPTINDNCTIKTRAEFYDELKSEINKNQNKIILLAMHHPIWSNGPHGGQFSLKKQLYPINNKIPLPFLGSFLNLIRKTSGASPQDLQNKKYQELVNQIKPLIQNKNNILVVSGHEHNLQYIEYDGIKQLISGAASKSEAARAIHHNDFSYGGLGFAKVDIYENSASKITFFSTSKPGKTNNIHTIHLESPFEEKSNLLSFEPWQQTTYTSSIYPKSATQKSKTYQWMLGKHYRNYFGIPIEAPVAYLDTLFGGVTPTIAGGGSQSESLRLVNKNGNEFVMRALKKNPTRFLQSIFKDQNAIVNFSDTYAEKFIADFYTSAHPFTPFIISHLMEPLEILHSKPKLYYIPKQPVLGNFNATFGNRMYQVEERQSNDNVSLEIFGKPNDILGTDELLENLRKDEKYQIDEQAYIRARIFDMLIGDWDRHQDQWRWAEFVNKSSTIYKPIPRDRDQAFAKVDGALIKFLTTIPGVRHITEFRGDFPSEKWFNFSAHSLDVALIKKANENDWLQEVALIQAKLTDETINKAFENLPKEIRNDQTTLEIIKNVIQRRDNLEKFVKSYYQLLQKRIILTGTDKKDQFLIENLANKTTKITHTRLKKSGEELQFSKTYTKKQTKEIWIYGLDDDDEFIVIGKKKQHPKIRLIGGQNHDIYNLKQTSKVAVYDYKSKSNTINTNNTSKISLKDDYEINEYHYKKPKYNHTFTIPVLGYNPDDGIKIGGHLNAIQQNFITNPFTAKHVFNANYYFATQGVEITYKNSFTRVVGNWNLETTSRYTTPNFSINFFGYGNETKNEDSDKGMDYNRVRIQYLQFIPALQYKNNMGSEITLATTFERIKVDQTSNRFISEPNSRNNEVFDNQNFSGISAQYRFNNYNNKATPTLGMRLAFKTEWKWNWNNTKQNFAYVEGEWGVTYPLIPSGKIVIGTLFKAKALLNNHFEFYQGATLGGDYDLRGFRNERFLGKQSFFQSTDIRWTIGTIKSIVPMKYGILTGYDYGRVWLDNENSKRWHQSFGGGFWISSIELVTARLTFFNSEDGNRIAFGLGFGF